MIASILTTVPLTGANAFLMAPMKRQSTKKETDTISKRVFVKLLIIGKC